MQAFRFLAVVQLMSVGLWLAMGADGRAVDAARKSVQPKQTDKTSAEVAKALSQEVEGNNEQRNEILKSILEESPDHAPAQWHSGHVWFGKQWLDYRQFPKALRQDKRIADYWSIRDRCKDEPDHQFKLGQWCFDRKLMDQARAHWMRVLDLDPENEEAHQRLGHESLGEEWLTGEQLDDLKQSEERQKKAAGKWSRELESIAKGLQNKSPKQREHAKKRLLEIDDPSIVGPLVSMLIGQSEEAEQLLVEVLGKIDTADSSAALAGLAVTSRWRPLRTAAARQLRPRKMDDYVPLLLSNASTEIVSQYQVVPGPRSVQYRHVFFREGQDRKEVVALSRDYQISSQSPTPGLDVKDCAKASATSATQAETWREQQNIAIREMNERIAEAIYGATGHRLPSSPSEWWKWWDELNEVYVTGEKKVVGYAKNEQVQVSSTVAGSGGGPSSGLGDKGNSGPPGATSSPGGDKCPQKVNRAELGRNSRANVPTGRNRAAQPAGQEPERVQGWQKQPGAPQDWQMGGRGGAWQMPWHGGGWQRSSGGGGAWQQSGGGGQWQQAGAGGQWQQAGAGGQWQKGGGGGQQAPAAPVNPVPEKKEEPKPTPPSPPPPEPPRENTFVPPVARKTTTKEERQITKSTDPDSIKSTDPDATKPADAATKSSDADGSKASKSPGADGGRPAAGGQRDNFAAIASKGRAQRYDCLAPGTKVWTESGLYAIEEIRVGDLVLSQDAETGQLQYKPVVRVTLRPKGALLQITAGDNKIESSGGHPFWVSGQGWVKARDLKPGMRIHSVTGVVEVQEVADNSSQQQTHNLVVADFHTYFIGKAKLLTHDNTTRKPTQSIVPGLAKQ